MKKRTPLTAAILSVVLLCSCGSSEEPINTDDGYNIISSGTSVHIDEPTEKNEEPTQEYADFYIPEGMFTSYASEELSGRRLEVYNELTDDIGHFKTTVPLELSSDIYSELLNLLSIEQLSYSHLIGRSLGDYNLDTNTFDVIFDYRFTPEEMSEMNRESEAVADSILEGIDEKMSEYEKLKYIHDYLVKNCSSDAEDEYSNTIYGTLVRKKALCEGYSKTFSYLCNRLGIENMIITGQTSVPHMWNMVKVDGNWYHIDVTWDKPEGLLLELYPNMVMYQYFMVTDSVIENDHTIVPILRDAPHAYSTRENYFVKEGKYITGGDDIVPAIQMAFDDAVTNRKNVAMVKFDTNNLMLSTIRNIKSSSKDGDGGFLKGTIETIGDKYGVKLNVGWTDYYSNYRILVFIIDYGDSAQSE